MNLVRGYGTRSIQRKLFMFVLLVTVCISINLLGAYFVKIYELPMYLDCIGTIIAAMFGGYNPGIFVGLTSSILNGVLVDSQLVSYGVLNVFIGVYTAWAQDRGWFKKIRFIVLSVFVYAFIGGTLGSLLTIVLYGFAQDESSSQLVLKLYDSGLFSKLWSEIFGNTIIDIFDKTVTLAIAVAVNLVVPKKIKGQFRIHAWQQAPLKSDTINFLINNKTRKYSLKTKIVGMVFLACALVSISSIIISFILYKSSMESSAIIGLTDAQLQLKATRFLVNQVSLFVGVFILIVSEFIYLAQFHIILPMNTMAYVASTFTEDDRESLREVADNFKKLEIKTGDETENLYNVLTVMTRENADFLDDIERKNTTISELQNSLIVVLADLVESRDFNTGNHIKATAEYVELIMDQMITEGIYKEQMTPQFVSDVYRSAPLHDIGKISVSDVILNKPGKLTDEEFAIMKNHSLAGAEIIDHVIETLPNSDGGYLHEARNLALYHHEKWDGSGYPYGISGEDIPLSARIMAVADVFDALVSKRSYKKAFEFDKAMGIIEESAGTHFDPLIANAFLHAKDRIKKVAEEKDWNNV